MWFCSFSLAIIWVTSLVMKVQEACCRSSSHAVRNYVTPWFLGNDCHFRITCFTFRYILLLIERIASLKIGKDQTVMVGKIWLDIMHCLASFCFAGWVNTLVGGQKSGAKGFMFFIVNVDLSEEGIGKHEKLLNLLRLRQNGHHLADNIVKFISLYEIPEFWFKFHWSVFQRDWLAISYHWFR